MPEEQEELMEDTINVEEEDYNEWIDVLDNEESDVDSEDDTNLDNE